MIQETLMVPSIKEKTMLLSETHENVTEDRLSSDIQERNNYSITS